jgi:hypothetical protein
MPSIRRQLDERLPPARFDRAERVAHGLLLAHEHALGPLRLDDDDADRVRDDVVQFARDPRTLLRRSEPGPLVALSLEPAGASPQLDGLEPPPPEGATDDPCRRTRGDRADVEAAVPRHRVSQLTEEQQRERDAPADERLTSLAMRAHG